MNKRKLHHVWKQLHRLSYWYFLAGALVFLISAVLALRNNNLTALRLRDQVTQADKTNNHVETSLGQLRSFVYAHMNANLASDTSVYPPIQLKYTYDRLVAAEKTRVDAINTRIYNDAQHHCEALNSVDFSGRNRVPCIQAYVTRHGAKEQPIPDGLYKFDFISPVWSPDVAGWSLVLASVFGFLFAVRFGLEVWLKQSLKQHA